MFKVKGLIADAKARTRIRGGRANRTDLSFSDGPKISSPSRAVQCPCHAVAWPLCRFQVYGTIESIAHLDQKALFARAGQIAARDTCRRQFSRPYCATFPSQGDSVFSQRRFLSTRKAYPFRAISVAFAHSCRLWRCLASGNREFIILSFGPRRATTQFYAMARYCSPLL